jgi:hypothetical protein
MVPASSEDRGSKIGPYRVVTADQELAAEPTAYVLDTNDGDPDEVSRVALQVVSGLERQIGVTALTGSRG